MQFWKLQLPVSVSVNTGVLLSVVPWQERGNNWFPGAIGRTVTILFALTATRTNYKTKYFK
jgi:hypothetical protein